MAMLNRSQPAFHALQMMLGVDRSMRLPNRVLEINTSTHLLQSQGSTLLLPSAPTMVCLDLWQLYGLYGASICTAQHLHR